MPQARWVNRLSKLLSCSFLKRLPQRLGSPGARPDQRAAINGWRELPDRPVPWGDPDRSPGATPNRARLPAPGPAPDWQCPGDWADRSRHRKRKLFLPHLSGSSPTRSKIRRCSSGPIWPSALAAAIIAMTNASSKGLPSWAGAAPGRNFESAGSGSDGRLEVDAAGCRVISPGAAG